MLISSTEDSFLNLILANFLPVTLVVEECLAKAVYCECQDLLRLAFWNDVSKTKLILLGDTLERDTYIFTGSNKEGLVIPPYRQTLQGVERVIYRDIDNHIQCVNIFELPQPSGTILTGEICTVEPISGEDPNYVRLRFTKEYSAARKRTRAPLNNDILLNTTVTSYLLDKLVEDSRGKFSCYIHGPAVTVTDAEGGEVDHCIGIHFDVWPDVAQDFVVRDRPSGWPDQALIGSITRKGYGLTPAGREYSAREQEEWRFSFSAAEQILAHSLTTVQRKVYVVVKLLHSFYFKQPAIFKTYYLKTTLFWLCEKIPVHYWCNTNAAFLICAFLDKVVHVLIDGSLPHYFIAGSNLLAGTHILFRKDLAMKVQHIRRHLLQSILHIDDAISFVFPRAKLREIFGAVIGQAHDIPGNTSADGTLDLFNLAARAVGFDIKALKQQYNQLMMCSLIPDVLPNLGRLIRPPIHDNSHHTNLLLESFKLLSVRKTGNVQDTYAAEFNRTPTSNKNATSNLRMLQAHLNTQIRILINSFMQFYGSVPCSKEELAIFVYHLMEFLLLTDVPVILIARVLYILHFMAHHRAASIAQCLAPSESETDESTPVNPWFKDILEDSMVKQQLINNPGIYSRMSELRTSLADLSRDHRCIPSSIDIYRVVYTDFFVEQGCIEALKPETLLLSDMLVSSTHK